MSNTQLEIIINTILGMWFSVIWNISILVKGPIITSVFYVLVWLYFLGSAVFLTRDLD
jgi:hypothetical protein